jgi:hypothetical protein
MNGGPGRTLSYGETVCPGLSDPTYYRFSCVT